MKFRVGSITALMSLIMGKDSSVKPYAAYRLACMTKRIRVSSHTPHYGAKAAARNLRHAKAGTHGLRIDRNGHIQA